MKAGLRWACALVVGGAIACCDAHTKDYQTGNERMEMVPDTGGCYVACDHSSKCNEHTHECERVAGPCGTCGVGQQCDTSQTVPTCVTPDAGAPP